MERNEARERLLAAMLPHVVFDGWSDPSLRAAIADSGVEPALARALFPRGGIDLALAWHRAGDAEMVRLLAARDLSDLRIRDRVALAVMTRFELAEREAVRRAMALFSLPQHAGEGARALWGTADAIWNALGDDSQGLNRYTKRASLSAVYGATVLFWLGDESSDHQATRDFLDRRIAGVMRIEKAKAALRRGLPGRLSACGPLARLRGAPQQAQGAPGAAPAR